MKAPGASGEQLTDDAFLGGALQILQPRLGYRAGIDAVLLAAAVPDLREPLEVIDIGAGVGTAGLCLARRIPYAKVVLLEREPELAQIAVENVRRNGLTDRVRVIEGEVGMASAELDLARTERRSVCSRDRQPAFSPARDRNAGSRPAQGRIARNARVRS